MNSPHIALGNIFDQDAGRLAYFAHGLGFEGIDWSVSLDVSERDFVRKMDQLKDFEVRYHCRFFNIDLAYEDQRSEQAMDIFRRIIGLVSTVRGRYITVHIGLGQSSDKELDWRKAIKNLSSLVSFGYKNRVTVCLENLTTVWTSKPRLFKTLIGETGAGVTFDIGHAHVCLQELPEENLYGRYISPHLGRVFNAHIYHTEDAQRGHVAPENLDQMIDRLKVLRSATNCDWWVIELMKPEEVLRTRGILSQYLSLSERAPEQIPVSV